MWKKLDSGNTRRIVDITMTVLLLCLMAYQVTGEAAHEYIGMGMTILVIVHQILNRRWYGALFKGNYHAYRILQTVVNILLIGAFILTAFCGMSMSGYAVPFLYGMAKVSFVRRMHLSMSHWAFVLMGLHIGLHVPVMIAQWKLNERQKNLLSLVLCVIAGTGFALFLKNGMPDYLFFKVPFAFLDYEKSAGMVFLENGLMLLTWVFAGLQLAHFCQSFQGRNQTVHKWKPILFLLGAVVIGLVLRFVMSSASAQSDTDWSTASVQATAEPEETAGSNDTDGYRYIDGGTFLMGNPETENWRIADEAGPTHHMAAAVGRHIDTILKVAKIFNKTHKRGILGFQSREESAPFPSY